MPKRVATIDLGSNSCVLLVLEARSGRVERVTSELALTRLGQGLDASGDLSDEAIQRSLDALERFAVRAKDLGATEIHAVGTAALREARNQDVVIQAAHRFGVELRPITGAEEAALSFAAAQYGAAADCVVIDVGGASTELAWGGSSGLRGRVSLKVGSVRLHERLALEAPMTAPMRERLEAACRGALKDTPKSLAGPLVAVAGTATTAAQIHLGLRAYDPDRLDQQVLTREDLMAMLEALAARSVAERMASFGLPEGRADVLPAGLSLLLAALERLGLERLTVRDRGVAWGEGLRHLA